MFSLKMDILQSVIRRMTVSADIIIRICPEEKRKKFRRIRFISKEMSMSLCR